MQTSDEPLDLRQRKVLHNHNGDHEDVQVMNPTLPDRDVFMNTRSLKGSVRQNVEGSAHVKNPVKSVLKSSTIPKGLKARTSRGFSLESQLVANSLTVTNQNGPPVKASNSSATSNASKQLSSGIIKVKNRLQAPNRSSNGENSPKGVKKTKKKPFPKLVTSTAQKPLIPINQNQDSRRKVQFLVSSSDAPKTLNRTLRFEQQNLDGISPTVAIKNILHNKILMDNSQVNKMKEKIESLEATVSTLKSELKFKTTIMDQIRNLSGVSKINY